MAPSNHEHVVQSLSTCGVEGNIERSAVFALVGGATHHPKLNNAAFPPVATVFHVTARSTANLGR